MSHADRESAEAEPRRLPRKAAAGWLAAALVFTGAASPPAHGTPSERAARNAPAAS